MKRSTRVVAYLAVGSIVILAGLYGISTINRPRADVDPGRLATVERGDMVRSVVATGRIEPITKVEIKSKANGIIKSLNVEIGDLVRPGDVLAELDKEMLLARAREASANLLSSKAALEISEAELAKNLIEAEGPDVEYFRRTYQRARDMFEQKVVAQSDLDKTKTELELAENRRQAAQSQLSITRAKITQARANVAQAAAALERAEEELANATIRAPIRGTVLTRDVEIGSPVSSILNLGAAATLVMTLGNIDQVFVRGKVDESDMGPLQLNLPARITVETFRDKVFQGRVTRISPMGVEKDNVTTFEVEVSLDNAAKDLRPNMTANAEIVLQEKKDVLVLPLEAIRYDSAKRSFVETPQLEGRGRVEVKLGIGNSSKTELLQGLRLGDKVLLP